MKSSIPIESNIHPFEGYTHSEIVNEINTLIDIIDINEFESIQDIIDYINESYKVFDRTIPQDIVHDIIINKCNKKYIINDTSSEDSYISDKTSDRKCIFIDNGNIFLSILFFFFFVSIKIKLI
jgi:hypothetical protein